jgi:hypothetical protein
MARRRFMQSFPGISARSLFAAKTHPSAHFPKFAIPCRKHFRELRKVMGTSKLMILVPLFDLRSLGRTRGKQRRDFRSAALVLSSFSDEVCATIARLFAYMGTLALLGILTLHGWDQLQLVLADEPAARPGWSPADRSSPAFAVGGSDSHDKSVAYVILRHREGGRKDILRWTGPAAKILAEVEIYRPGSEFDPATGAGLAARMGGTLELETSGVLDSKFGAVSLLRQAGRAEASSCLAFFKRNDDPALQFSGFSCERDSLPARRAAVGCMLDRLILLTSGNEPKLAEMFAQAELKRGGCAPAGLMADWMTSTENPQLRGAF